MEKKRRYLRTGYELVDNMSMTNWRDCLACKCPILADRGLSGRPSIGQIRHFERGYEGMSIFGEGL